MTDPSPNESVWQRIGPSVIRTVVPVVAGVIITLAIKAGLSLSNSVVTGATTIVVTTIYYAVARWLEGHTAPIAREAGRLLLTVGLTSKKPTY